MRILGWIPILLALAAPAGAQMPDEAGVRLQPWATVFLRGADPHRQLTPLYLDVRDAGVDPAWRAQLGLDLDARLAPSLTAVLRFHFDSEGRNDLRNRTRDFGQLGASNNIDEAWLRWQGGRGALTLGRVPIRWGPERLGGLLLSGVAPAPETLHARLCWGPHRMESFAAQLSSQDGLRRWLYGHRLTLRLPARLTLGLSEVTVVAGPNESLSLRYANPILFHAQAQAEDHGDDGAQVNVLDAVDLSWEDDHSRLYGSLVVDDLQIDAAGRDRNPDQLAWAVGGEHRRGRQWVGYEYRRIGSWTYLHMGDGTGHSQFGRPLGAEEGPDTDRHQLVVGTQRGAWHLWIEGEHRRRGINRLWTQEDRSGHAGEPYPRPTVERRWIAGLGVERDLGGYGKAALTAAFHDIQHLNNGPEDEGILQVLATLHLRAPALRWLVGDEATRRRAD